MKFRRWPALVLALLLTACTSDAATTGTPTSASTTEAQAPTTTTVAPTTSTTEASTTTESEEAAVIAAFHAFNDAYAAASDPFDPMHPLLERHATGQVLERIQLVFADNAAERLVSRGEYVVGKDLSVEFDDATSARLVVCTLDSVQIVDADGNTVVAASTEPTLSVAFLRRDAGGTWRVSDEGFLGGTPELCEL